MFDNEDYDYSLSLEEENEENYPAPYPNNGIIWKSSNGDTFQLHQMTVSHLRNAIRYEYRKKGRYTFICEKLEAELKKRHDKEFFNQTRDCPFCDQKMKMIECRSNPEEGVGWGWIKYKFACECGGTSKWVEKPPYKAVKLDDIKY